MPRSALKKTKCPYCKKAHRCHNKCASKRVSARITREGKPRAARAVGRAIARGCSPRRGRRSKAAKRYSPTGKYLHPSGVWKRAPIRPKKRRLSANARANLRAGYAVPRKGERGEPIQIVGRGGKPGKVIHFPTAQAAKDWAKSKGVYDRMVFVRDT